MFKKYWWLIAVLALVLVVFVVNKPKEVKDKKTATVVRGTLQEKLTLSAVLDAKEKVRLMFLSGGKLAKVAVKEGDYVKKGQLIASLDTRTVNRHIQKSLNAYSITRSQFDQVQQDNKNPTGNTDVNSTQERKKQQSQYTLDNSVLDVEIATISREAYVLTAPINGIVYKVDAPFAGMNVTASDGYSIVNPDTYFVTALADQTEIIKLKEGMEAMLTLDAYPDTPVKAFVNFLSFTPEEGEVNTVYKVELVFSKESFGVSPRLGMTGDVEFVLREKSGVLMLPSQFVKTDKQKGEKYVWLAKEGKAVKKTVTVGETLDGKVEIVSGLQEGNEVYDSP